jgi:hypothetical protein
MKMLTPDLLGKHGLITSTDRTFFLKAFSRGVSRDSEPWNRFVRDLKISPQCGSAEVIRRKREAVLAFATELGEALPIEWIRSATFVPTPSSVARGDPAYDPRVFEVLRNVSPPLNVRCLVEQRVSRPALHLADEPCTVEQLADGYCVNDDGEENAPTHIVIVDDIIATGLHFRAMSTVLGKAFPPAQISGLFLARRAHEHDA